ncbi:MAG: DUF192 domain-containing protein [Dysgonamonadaceae bacterium]|jgi:uncharacterized membrane protein (UPF0127 family)|nr:DUF192 domain-containing protein [Dysgonamonadaceae bacterium]
MKKSSSKKSHQKRTSKYAYVIIGLLVVAVLAWYCAQLPSKRVSPITPQQSEALNIPFVKQGELTFISAAASDTLARINIEVADDFESRRRGLMFRSSIPENGGMLFLMELEEMQSFWMQNTHISLDILYVNANMKIIDIHANTKILSEQSYFSSAPALYVVEVNAGFSYRNNINVGDKISFVID